MSSTKVWFITGAGRGMGSDFAKAALAAGHAVVATGRIAIAYRQRIGEVDRAPDRHARRQQAVQMLKPR